MPETRASGGGLRQYRPVSETEDLRVSPAITGPERGGRWSTPDRTPRGRDFGGLRVTPSTSFWARLLSGRRTSVLRDAGRAVHRYPIALRCSAGDSRALDMAGKAGVLPRRLHVLVNWRPCRLRSPAPNQFSVIAPRGRSRVWLGCRDHRMRMADVLCLQLHARPPYRATPAPVSQFRPRAGRGHGGVERRWGTGVPDG